MKAIFGLGNPGNQYARTRHNVGFRVVDWLADINRILIGTKRFKSLYGTGFIDSQKVIFVKPMTFMNRSGEAVKKTVDFFHLEMKDLVVVHDDLDLAFGRFRFKRRGGDGGHQGVRSIIESLNENGFLRLKVGIGRPPKSMDPADYVLQPFDATEQLELEKVTLARAADSIRVLLFEGVEAAMNQYH